MEGEGWVAAAVGAAKGGGPGSGWGGERAIAMEPWRPRRSLAALAEPLPENDESSMRKAKVGWLNLGLLLCAGCLGFL